MSCRLHLYNFYVGDAIISLIISHMKFPPLSQKLSPKCKQTEKLSPKNQVYPALLNSNWSCEPVTYAHTRNSVVLKMRHHQSRVSLKIYTTMTSFQPIRESLIYSTYVILAPPTFAEEYIFHSRDHHFSIFPGSFERDLVAWRYAGTDASTFPRKTIEITTKHLIFCSSINNMWREPLKSLIS